MTAAPSTHANCVAIGERGVLIRGEPGSGKSGLSATLVARAREAGRFARLVSDDRTLLRAVHGRLIASPPAALAGLIERRGVGIASEPHLSEIVVGLVVDLVASPDRMPEPEALACAVAGVSLPRVAIDPKDPRSVELILECLILAFNASDCGRFALAFAPQHEKIAPSAS